MDRRAQRSGGESEEPSPGPSSGSGSRRVILHVDMDAFFAAVEQLDRPELRGKPLLIGSASRRGVVSTASYEARPYGCGSAQPMAVALRLCPHAIVVPPRGARYAEMSRRVFEILREMSPLVEPLSIDEAFVDLTGTEGLHGDPVTAAEALRARIRERTGLTASVGLAPNKFLAKLGSDENKPDGLTVIGPREIAEWLPALPVRKMWGVGERTEAKLRAAGFHTIGDLARAEPALLARVLGRDAERVRRLARGEDSRPVVPHHEPKSLGHERTFAHDLVDPSEVRAVLLGLTESVGRRLRKHGFRARGVVLKIRYGDYETITRSRKLERPTDRTDELWAAAAAVFDAWAEKTFRPVRLIGVTAAPLTREPAQLGLFDGEDRERGRRSTAVDSVTDEIARRFGPRAIRRGRIEREAEEERE